MLEKVLEKISKQQEGKENTAVWMVGEQLKDICRSTPGAAEIILQDLDVAEMSIENAEKKIKEYADEQHKKNKGNCACVPPNVAEDIIREFYGIKGLAGAETNSQAVVNSAGDTSFIDLKNFL